MIFFKNLSKKKKIVHGVMETKDGSFNFFTNKNSVNNLLEAVRKKRSGVGVEDIVMANQIHGKNVHVVSPLLSGYIKLNADGLISKKRGQIVAIKTADCLPVLIYNPEKDTVGAIHAGRKGLEKGILEEAVQKMGNRNRLIIGIGPHIRKCCYSFLLKDKKLWRQELENTVWEKYTQEKNKALYLDLTRFALDQLERLGVEQKNIEVSKICTSCAKETFFSARVAKKSPAFYKKYGRRPRTGSFIGLI